MPIEELLALYNCVPPPMPITSLSTESSSKRSSRRVRSTSAIHAENTPSVPDALPPSTAIESASCSQSKSDASTSRCPTGTGTDGIDAVAMEQEKSNTEHVKIEIEKIEMDVVEASTSPIKIPVDEVDAKIKSDKVQTVAEDDAKRTESVELNRDSEFTEVDEGDDDDDEEDESELRKLYPETFKTNEPRLLRGEWATCPVQN